MLDITVWDSALRAVDPFGIKAEEVYDALCDAFYNTAVANNDQDATLLFSQLRIYGLVDGKFLFCARNTLDVIQNVMYSGNHRAHGLNFTGIVIPNGILFMTEAEAGSSNDQGMLNRTLSAHLSNVWQLHIASVLGDAGYSTGAGVVGLYKRTLAMQDADKLWFNKTAAPYRTSIENAFTTITQPFRKFQTTTDLRLSDMPVGNLFRAAVLLGNCRTCIRSGNQISDRFGLAPPLLEDYLAGKMMMDPE